MKILYERNLVNASVLTSPQVEVITPMENLYDYRLSAYTKFKAINTQINIHIEFITPVAVDSIGIGGHSFSALSTISVNGGAEIPIHDVHTLVEISPDILNIYDITITDSTLSAGEYRYIGRLELGQAFSPPEISSNIKVDRISNSDAVFSSSRQVYGYRKASYRRMSMQMPLVEEADRQALMLFFESVDVFVPFFFYINDDCVEIKPNYVIVSDSNIMSFQLTEGMFYTAAFSISEVF